MTAIGVSEAKNTLHEWQTDALRDADATNARIEGDDAAGASLSATTRANNRTQISDKTIIVSGTQEAVNKAGRKSELAYQLIKASKEFKRDIEKILVGNQASVTGNSTTARKLRSLESWYATNTSRGSSGANGSTSAAATDGTQRTFTETLLKTVLQSIFTNGGSPNMLMLGANQKQVFSGFTGNSTRYASATDKALTATVDLYVSDFGELKIVPNRFQRDRTCHIIQPDMWALAYLQPFLISDLGKTGNSYKKQVVAEYTLEARNEASSGVVADLS